ncbi:MAG TPA: hypothetical protein VGM94_00810 [Galbitalea sp.]|jgi:hypothetical protein
MGALKDLFDSAHSMFAVILSIGAVVLTALGKMTTDQFITYSEWIYGIFAGATAGITVADKLATGKVEAAKAAAIIASMPKAA